MWHSNLNPKEILEICGQPTHDKVHCTVAYNVDRNSQDPVPYSQKSFDLTVDDSLVRVKNDAFVHHDVTKGIHSGHRNDDKTEIRWFKEESGRDPINVFTWKRVGKVL